MYHGNHRWFTWNAKPYFLSFFKEKIRLSILCELSATRWFRWNISPYFLWKIIIKEIIRMSSTILLVVLTFTSLPANSADHSRKQNLIFHAKCLHWRQFAWHVKSGFPGKNISVCHLLKILLRMLSIHMYKMHNNICSGAWNLVRNVRQMAQIEYPKSKARLLGQQCGLFDMYFWPNFKLLWPYVCQEDPDQYVHAYL